MFPDGDPKLRITLEKGIQRFDHSVTAWQNYSGGDPRQAEMLRDEVYKSTLGFRRALDRWIAVKL
jgi:hypothetical protein